MEVTKIGPKPHETVSAWLNNLRSERIAIGRERARLDELRAKVGCKRQHLGDIVRASMTDGTGTLLALIDAEKAHSSRISAWARECQLATMALWGAEGLSKARSQVDADCVDGYYLQALTWPLVASELVRPDSRDGAQWCKRRAYRALAYMDALGLEAFLPRKD